MRTPASVRGHPIHPMLIVFPVGLFIFSLVCDIASTFSADTATWKSVALYSMVGGVVGALAAAVPGLVDLLSLTDHRIKNIALAHMTINLVVVALYVLNVWLRISSSETSRLPPVLSVISIAILAVSGWLGGKLVYEHGVGVDTGKLE